MSAPDRPLRVAIVGASGYTGAELVRLLLGHPRVTITMIAARRAVGQRLATVFPHLTGKLDLPIVAFDADLVAAAADVAFAALPHGESATVVAALVARGVPTLDLSADFRLRDAATWAQWYGGGDHPVHPAPALLAEAVYGLPERHRAQLPGARLVAVPGCYPTATALAIAPLLAAGLVHARGLIVDAKSGASGAGRSPGLATHLPEAAEGLRAYKVGGSHRHTPEIEQELGAAAGASVAVLFTPHLVPMSRGILACVYAEPTDPARTTDAYRAALIDAYRGEPFVDVLPPGQLPDTAYVRGSNRCHVQVVHDPRSGRVLAMSAIDNLVKGAAGQALQCLNLVRGWPETLGLDGAPMFP
ncbi:MAG: N-acetyl-gamma-glutamyl-phosphate reductase [Myxococcales bacterium]|nr:N-acetyl-gamma-glutamyl-phosphate reductase [Myxococcales bacterium]